MKFTVVFGFIFLLLEVEGSSMLDATVAMSKPQEAAHSATLGKNTAVPKVMHMDAQSTIPTKIVHAHAAATKLKVPMAALTGIKKSDDSKPSHKQPKKWITKPDPNFNKSNHWGLYDAQANASAANQTRAVQAHAIKSKDNVAKKPATNVSSNHTQEKKHVVGSVPKAITTSIPKALPAVNKEHSKEPHEAKPPLPTTSHVTAVKPAAKETKKYPSAEVPKITNQKSVKASAPKVAAKQVKSTNGTAANRSAGHATAIVKAAPKAPHALVHSKSKTVSKATTALAAQNKAEYQLLNFLASEMQKKELPPFEVYLPACLEHLHDLIDNLDMAYTDVQLHSVLVDECWLKKSFPESHDSSFSTDAACKKFATSLVNARYLELQTGSQEGYEGFCADYYVHIGGDLGKKKAEAPPPPKKKSTQSFPWHFVVVAAVILILFAIILCMVVSKRNSQAA
eukprot:gnl/MRDRNA2_/MRDRNA2_92838_c0_seq1.p1 gnl/MRDRNA2_/MRDRNA2_92838_c0~~gnl/MRDRNA2_/MRDRNA2_92838_c0_seq1.p1  ORF type:complete len:453 (+),score=112.43 gnl/MRDRNA2_/MRDRNA2_92838_c0_seq1:93-1451(+)